MIVDCVIKRLDWRTSPWRHLCVSSFGVFVMSLFADLFTAPSSANVHRPGVWLGGGQWRATDDHDLSVADGSHDGEALLVLLHVSGWARCTRRDGSCGRGSSVAPRGGSPRGHRSRCIVDDSTKKKAGRQIEGMGHYRNGAGTARQEYRTLRGLNFVWGHDARSGARLAGPEGQCSHRLVAVPQRGAGATS